MRCNSAQTTAGTCTTENITSLCSGESVTADGDVVGADVAAKVGLTVAAKVLDSGVVLNVESTVGTEAGTEFGDGVALVVGSIVGTEVGSTVGTQVGTEFGDGVALVIGSTVGTEVGTELGDGVALEVGFTVGILVS